MEKINIDDFAKVDIRIGTIISADFVDGADKLIVFKVDIGETIKNDEGQITPYVRQILSGVREHYPDPSALVGLQVPVLCNLPIRKLRGLDSEGMILYCVGESENFKTICPSAGVENGTQVG